MTILSIIKEVAEEPGKNKKIEILKKYKDNTLLQEVFKYALNPNINYWIKKIPSFHKGDEMAKELAWAVASLDRLADRTHTGHAGRDFLQEILCSLYLDDAEVIVRIIERDLKMGASESTINKVWKKLVPTTKVMLANQYNDKTKKKVKFPVFTEDKEDGMRCFVVVDSSDVVLKSRSGKEIQLHGNFIKEFSALNFNQPKMMYDGELLVLDDEGNILDRKTGNGILNKAVKGTITKEDADKVIIRLWDMVPYDKFIEGKYEMPASERHKRIRNQYFLVDNVGRFFSKKIEILDATLIETEEELQETFKLALSEGKEGLIVKNPDGPWVNKRSNDWLKMKAQLEMDLIVTDWVEGTGKYKGMLGSLEAFNKDRMIKVNVGTGLTDEDRKEIGPEVVGKTINVNYNEIIESRDKKEKSLFLPVFVEVREDV